jgi:flagellar biosynthesis GTPase FlhF
VGLAIFPPPKSMPSSSDGSAPPRGTKRRKRFATRKNYYKDCDTGVSQGKRANPGRRVRTVKKSPAEASRRLKKTGKENAFRAARHEKLRKQAERMARNEKRMRDEAFRKKRQSKKAVADKWRPPMPTARPFHGK